MTDEEFDQLVVAECKDPEAVDSGILYADLPRWQATLKKLIFQVDEQRMLKAADVDQAEADYYDDEQRFLQEKAHFTMWDAKSRIYQRHLKDRLNAVTDMLTGEVQKAIEKARERVLTEVARVCKLGDGTKELQAAWLAYEIAMEMKESNGS
jgi:hypothetical protein